MAASKRKGGPPGTASEAWRAGYEQGLKDAAMEFQRKFYAEVRAEDRRMRGYEEFITQVRLMENNPPTGETPAQKSARTRRLQRMVRDEQQARELAILILEGHTTESARLKIGNMGKVRAQRIRAVAVRLGLLEGRKRKS